MSTDVRPFAAAVLRAHSEVVSPECAGKNQGARKCHRLQVRLRIPFPDETSRALLRPRNNTAEHDERSFGAGSEFGHGCRRGRRITLE